MVGWLLAAALLVAACTAGKDQEVRFQLVDVQPDPFVTGNIDSIEMVVGLRGNAGSYSETFDIVGGQVKLEATFKRAEVASLTLTGFRQGTAVGRGRVEVPTSAEASDVVPIVFTLYGVMHEFEGAGSGQRVGHTATALTDGRVLVVDADSAEIFDPQTGTVSATGAPQVTHGNHSALRLGDGRVLIVGGNVGIAQVELFDPATGTFSLLDNLGQQRTDRPALIETSPGMVLVAGGIPTPAVTTLAEIIDVDAGTNSAAGISFDNRAGAGSVASSDGTIVIAGGSQSAAALTTIEASDGGPVAVRDLSAARVRPAVADIPARGQVLVLGGFTDETGSNVVDVVERVHATNFGVGSLGSYTELAVGDSAVATLAGAGDTAVLMGGTDGTGAVDAVRFVTVSAGGTSIDVSDYAPGAETLVSNPTTLRAARTGAVAVTTEDGDVVLVGGIGAGNSNVPLYELLRPVP